MRLLAPAVPEMRADRVRHRHRQALPQRDEGAVFRVERIVLRDARAAVEAVLVGERRGLEAPVALEVEGAGALLAAAEVEDAHALLARPAHQPPGPYILRPQGARP